jgi:hypothetical protein
MCPSPIRSAGIELSVGSRGHSYGNTLTEPINVLTLDCHHRRHDYTTLL